MSKMNRRQFLNYVAVLPFALYFPNTEARSKRLTGIIHELSGDVFINKTTAGLSSTIQSGDRITVGYGGRLVFSMAEDSYLLQEGSSLELVSHDGLVISGLSLLTGGLLSVFGKRSAPTTIYTRTATIGIRGTGVYLNSQPEKLYFCNCYGKTDLNFGGHHEHIASTHHNAFDVTGRTDRAMSMTATQVVGHTDDELRLLEQYSGRKPLFDL